MKTSSSDTSVRPVIIRHGALQLPGDLWVSPRALGWMIFAHGSGSSRLSPRNQFVARSVQAFGIGTLLFDLLTAAEQHEDSYIGHLRFDIPLLAERLIAATEWLVEQMGAQTLPLAYFGSSTGAAATLVAAAKLGRQISAVVSRGGRPDLAGEYLPRVGAPVLLIVGGNDPKVLELNKQARDRMRCETCVRVVPGATHLFEEAGALEQVVALAAEFVNGAFQGHGAQ